MTDNPSDPSPRKLSFNSASRHSRSLMFTLFRLLARFPLPLLHAAGAFAGWLTWIASAHYRRRLRENAAQAGLGRKRRVEA